jgi:hypothetical protein
MDNDSNNGNHIYRSSIKLRNGKRIFAKNYGKSAFKIPVRCDYMVEDDNTDK